MSHPTTPCPPWCRINHDVLGPAHVNNIGQAIETGETTVETNVVAGADGGPVILVAYGTPADMHRVKFGPAQALSIAYIISLCTLAEIRQFGIDLTRAAGVVRSAQ